MKSAGQIPADLPAHFKGHAYLLYDHAERPLTGQGILLVGDSAGLAYTQSGEGIRPAIESALIAAEVIGQAADCSSASLATYHSAVTQRFGSRPGRAEQSWQVPDWVKMPLARTLMRSHWFTRKIVTENWFLHQQVPPLKAVV
jgi:2-polyprenyl-6-methoxyphenol hydroxylase-like FAD-dependent oxidoreductase